MRIVPHFTPPLCPSFPLLPPSAAYTTRDKRLALPAPKLAGYLVAKVAGGDIEPTLRQINRVPKMVSIVPVKPEKTEKADTTEKPQKRERRVVTAEIVEQPRIDINIYEDPEGWWAEFERLFGRIRSIEEMDAELEAKHPGYLAWVAWREEVKAAQTAEIQAVRS